jgi:hypothetical protein
MNCTPGTGGENKNYLAAPPGVIQKSTELIQKLPGLIQTTDQ